MKYLIFLMFFHCSSNIKKAEDNVDLKKISIEWTGSVDKTFPKIIICEDCKDCKDYKIVLKEHQYKVSLKSLTEINSVFSEENKTEIQIKINEKNIKKYIPRLNQVLLILIENNENELLIQDIKTFIIRIE